MEVERMREFLREREDFLSRKLFKSFQLRVFILFDLIDKFNVYHEKAKKVYIFPLPLSPNLL